MRLSRTDTAAVYAVLVWWLLCAVLVVTVIVALWRYITTPPAAVYELSTGEYLVCTVADRDELACRIDHRENVKLLRDFRNNQEEVTHR